MTYRTLPLAVLAGLMISAAPVFAQSTTETTGAAAGSETAAAQAPDLSGLTADTVVVTVNGTAITLGEVIAVRQALPEQYQQLPDEVLLKALTDQLADQQVLSAAAEAAGLADSRAVKIAVTNQRRATLADAYMTRALIESLTDESIEMAYNERFANAEPVPEIRASHILVETEEQANGLKKQLDAGADFAVLATEHGTDGTAARGGDLGWFTREKMVPEFAEAAFALEKGQISAPVKSPFGWHLIYQTDRRDQPVPTLDEVRDQIVGELAQALQRQILDEARSGAQIDRPEAAIPAAAVRLDALIVEE